MPLMIFGFLALTGIFAGAQYPAPPPADPVEIPCLLGCSVAATHIQYK